MYARLAKEAGNDNHAELAAFYIHQGKTPDEAYWQIQRDRMNGKFDSTNPLIDKAKEMGSDFLSKVGSLTAQRRENLQDPNYSFMNSDSKIDDLLGIVANAGVTGMQAADKVLGPVTAVLDSPIAAIAGGRNPLKEIASNITKPMSEQRTLSDETGTKGLGGTLEDMAVPSTFLGGGLIRNFAKQGVKAATKSGAKNIGKAVMKGAIAAPVAHMLAQDLGGNNSGVLAAATLPARMKGSGLLRTPRLINMAENITPEMEKVIQSHIDNLTTKSPRVASTIHDIKLHPQMEKPSITGSATGRTMETAAGKKRLSGFDEGTMIDVGTEGRDIQDILDTISHEWMHGAHNAFSGGRPGKMDFRHAQEKTLPYMTRPKEISARTFAKSEGLNRRTGNKINYNQLLSDEVGKLYPDDGRTTEDILKELRDQKYSSKPDVSGRNISYTDPDETLLRQQLDEITPKVFVDNPTPEDVARYKELNTQLSDLILKREGRDLTDYSIESSKIPEGFYSEIEKQLGLLGNKSRPSIQLANQLRKSGKIKADEWADVGMDDILKQYQELTPQQALEEVRKRRPNLTEKRLGTGETDEWLDPVKFQKYSPARELPEGTSKYSEILLNQEGIYTSGTSHFDPETISHRRMVDISERGVDPEDQRRLEQLLDNWDYIKQGLQDPSVDPNIDFPAVLQEYYDLLKKTGEARKVKTPETILIESQSDLHQAGARKGYRTPEKIKRHHDLLLKLPGRQAYVDRKPMHPADRPSKVLAQDQLYSKLQRKLDRSNQYKYYKDFPEAKYIKNPRLLSAYQELFNRRQQLGNMSTAERIENLKGNPGEYQNFGSQWYPEDNKIGKKLLNLMDQMFNFEDMVSKPPANSALKNTWDLFNLKGGLKDAVEKGSKRFGISASGSVRKMLEDTTTKEGLDIAYDSTRPAMLEKFLRGQGIKAEFGPTERYSMGGEDWGARFLEITPEIEALVKKGLPLYAAIAMVNANGDR